MELKQGEPCNSFVDIVVKPNENKLPFGKLLTMASTAQWEAAGYPCRKGDTFSRIHCCVAMSQAGLYPLGQEMVVDGAPLTYWGEVIEASLAAWLAV